MKKFILLLLCAMTMSISTYAWKQIPLTVSIEDDNSPVGNGYPKSPIDLPTVYIEDYTLTFENYHPEYILNIEG